MARKLYRLLFGMKEHPETFAERGYPPLKRGQVYPGGYKSPDDRQLLFPGDVFAVEELLIMRDPALGGWTERAKDGTVKIACATLATDADRESWTARDEASRIGGYNISEKALAELERAEENASHVVGPIPPAAKNAPASVTPAGAP